MASGKRRKYDDIHMTPDVSYIKNLDVAHEESDVSVGPIAWFVLGLSIFSVIVCALMLLLFIFFERRAVESERRPSPLARRGEAALPPNPRLQASKGFVLDDSQDPSDVLTPQQQDFQLREPQAEYRALLKIWEQDLHGYGWMNQAEGTARVPIERAMQLYAEQQRQKRQPQGQPPQQQPGVPTPSAPVEQTPAASSSGRTGEATHQ
jgi:hypothetical protein